MTRAIEAVCAGLRWQSPLLLAGCNSEWLNARDRAVQANTTPPGPSYKADIVAFMRTYLNDPTGVRDAFVSEPALRTLENVERYTVCLRYTARKGAGSHTRPARTAWCCSATAGSIASSIPRARPARTRPTSRSASLQRLSR